MLSGSFWNLFGWIWDRFEITFESFWNYFGIVWDRPTAGGCNPPPKIKSHPDNGNIRCECPTPRRALCERLVYGSCANVLCCADVKCETHSCKVEKHVLYFAFRETNSSCKYILPKPDFR